LREPLLGEPGKGGLAAARAALGDLGKLMALSAPDQVEAAGKARLAAGAFGTLAPRVAAAHYPRPLLVELAEPLDGQLDRARTWDEATQTWLALAALNRAVEDKQRVMRLQEYRKRLTFPKDTDSPRDFVPPGLRPRNPGK